MKPVALQSRFLHCLDDPGEQAEAVEYLEDGILLIEDGHVSSLKPASDTRLPRDTVLVHKPDSLVIPGMVDTHVHYPQVDIIAAHGTQLLDWLERYTFPAEMAFADAEHGADTAQFFLDELLRNGTTTALVFGTVHPQSVDAFFEAAKARGLRMIAGKVMMDRNAPPELCDTAQSAHDDSERLIRDWHGKDRLGYAITPRFAPTSTPEQLQLAGELALRYPDVHVHTHLAENRDECDWVSSLFPDCADYLGVYERFGLVRKRSVFAHAIHMSDHAFARLANNDAAVAHCPCSNLFIGSGLFDLTRARQHGVRVGLGTDVGGGDSFSMLRVINEAYKVQQLQGENLSPESALYHATLGGAKALHLDHCIGNFTPGKEADLCILDLAATPLLTRRLAASRDWRETLFAIQMLGDDRVIADVWIQGQPASRVSAGSDSPG